MLRTPSYATRAKRIKKAKASKILRVMKTQIKNQCEFESLRSTHRRQVDFADFLAKATQESIGIFDPYYYWQEADAKKRHFASNVLLGASVLFRIIHWNKRSLDVLKRAIRSRFVNPTPNEFEDLIMEKCKQLAQQISSSHQPLLKVVKNREYRSINSPFLVGRPDLTFVNENQQPVMVVECKDISSSVQAEKLFHFEEDGRVSFRLNHEYVFQLAAYIFITQTESGILLVRYNGQVYCLKVEGKAFSWEEFELLRNFYLFVFLPKLILGTNPVSKNKVLSYFDENEIKLLEAKLEQNADVCRAFNHRYWYAPDHTKFLRVQ